MRTGCRRRGSLPPRRISEGQRFPGEVGAGLVESFISTSLCCSSAFVKMRCRSAVCTLFSLRGRLHAQQRMNAASETVSKCMRFLHAQWCKGMLLLPVHVVSTA